MLIYFVYLTYCKICDRLYEYKDTDLASLNVSLKRITHKCNIKYMLLFEYLTHDIIM